MSSASARFAALTRAARYPITRGELPAVVASAIQILLGRLLANLAPNTGVATIPYDKTSSDPDVVAAQRADPLTY